MNKLFVFSILLFFAGSKSRAQEVTFGAKIGANYATVTGDNSSSYNPVTALMIGAIAELTITDKWAFQPEIVFSRQGFNSENYDLIINYMNVPVMAKFYVTKGLSLEAGPQIGFRTLAIAVTPLAEAEMRERIKPVDFAVSGGIGYKLESGLNFGIRYNHGLSNINQYVGEKVSNQNAVFQTYVGLSFF